jgi:hypothetical protein
VCSRWAEASAGPHRASVFGAVGAALGCDVHVAPPFERHAGRFISPTKSLRPSVSSVIVFVISPIVAPDGSSASAALSADHCSACSAVVSINVRWSARTSSVARTSSNAAASAVKMREISAAQAVWLIASGGVGSAVISVAEAVQISFIESA